MHESIQNNDVKHARAVLEQLLIDNSYTTEEIWHQFEIAAKVFADLSLPFKVDGFNYEITDDREQWNKDYFLDCTSSLQTNFNSKRYKNALTVRDYLKNQGNPDFKFIQRTSS